MRKLWIFWLVSFATATGVANDSVAPSCERHLSLSLFRQIRNELNLVSDLFKQDESDDWSLDTAKSNWGSYDDSFQSLLSRTTPTDFNLWLDRRKASGQSTEVLDLFGSGNITPGMQSASSVTGVRLLFKSLRANRDFLDKLVTITGNIYDRSTWSMLKANMKLRNIESFDLITIRPIGGNPISALYYRGAIKVEHRHLLAAFGHSLFIVKRAFRVLSKNGGEICRALPRIEETI